MILLLRDILFKTKISDLLYESKQSIINLGYPEIVAKIFYKVFGNKSFIIAKWYKEYSGHSDEKDWFRQSHHHFRGLSIFDLVRLYYSTRDPEVYLKTLEDLELSTDDFINNESYLKERRDIIEKELEKELLNSTFFTYYPFISDIISGKIKDIRPYENLPFRDAVMRYDEKRLFGQMKPIKSYDNGYKWINVGKRCSLMGHYMKNCGSAGVMSTDSDRTMIGLFDPDNKPHVVVTYSPNEKRISGDEGVGSSEVKPEYHDYILDLVSTIGARFDTEKRGSRLLRLKVLLKDKAKQVKKIEVSKTPSIYNEYFRIIMNNNDLYYSDGYVIVSAEDIKRMSDAIKNKTLKLSNYQRNKIKDVFNQNNRNILKHFGVKFIATYEIRDL